MVKRIFRALGGEVESVHQAAYLLGAFALLAQLLAMFRDRMLAHYFGAGEVLDVYYAAFRIPDFIFATVASLVAGSVLIPLLQQKFLEGRDEAKKFIDEIWSGFSLLTLASCAMAFMIMPFLVAFLFPTIGEEEKHLTIALSRMLLFSPIFLGFSNFLGSIIQSERRFALYALSPVLYNVGIILGIIFLLPTFEINGVVMGVVLGSILHAAIQIPFIRSSGLFPKMLLPRMRGLVEVARISLPRTLALASGNLVFIALASIASRMTPGSISVFNFGYNLQSAALSIIGVSYSMAAFPTLSRMFAQGSKDKFVRYVTSSFRHIIFWSLPAAALFIIIRAQAVRVVLGSGAFTWSDTRLTAACVALFAISIIAQNANLLFIRAYYAAGKTRTPFYIAFASMLVTIGFSALFYWVFITAPQIRDGFAEIFRVADIDGTEVLALPLGFTVGSIVNMALFLMLFAKNFGSILAEVRQTFFQGLLASIVSGFVAYFALFLAGKAVSLDTLTGVFSQGLFAGIIGLGTWFYMLRVLGSREAEELLENIKKRIWRGAPPIAPDQTDI